QAMAMQNQLDFSRDMEREADRIGFGVMTQAGFAPEGAASMFEKLQYASRLNDNGSYPYLRSHPLNTERISDMQARFQFRNSTDASAVPGRISALPQKMDHAMIAARARVLSQPGVDVLRQWTVAASPSSGDLARQPAARQAGVLYAAALSSVELHENAAARALAERLSPLTKDDPAAARLTRLLQAEIELAAGAAPRAAALLGASGARDAGKRERPELLLAAQVAIALRQPDPMIAPLRDWVALHPRDALAWRTLGNLYGAQNDTLRAVRADAEANVAILDYAAARDRLKAAQTLASQGGNGGVVDHYEASIVDTRARAVEALWREQQEDKPLR
ncbi:MAG: peptidase, partial [Variovorax sp.]|nr:peptidase [Variovorax sp.]